MFTFPAHSDTEVTYKRAVFSPLHPSHLDIGALSNYIFPLSLNTQFPSSSNHSSSPPLMDVSHAKNDRYVRIEALRRQYKTCFKKLLLNLKALTSTSFSLHRLTKTGEVQHPTRTYGN